MLAFLFVNANQPVSADLLIDGLWEERPPTNAAKTIQIYVSRLRGRLGRERILTTPAGYLLRVEAEELDASSFERLAAEGRSLLEAGNAARAESVLSEALDLWRGEALADFRFNGFAQAEIGRLQERRASALADRIDARLALGHAEEVIPGLEVLVREQPLWERPRRQLMLALYQAGRQADALELYQATRSLLAAELGLDPSPELQALERAILNQESELARPLRPLTPSDAGRSGGCLFLHGRLRRSPRRAGAAAHRPRRHLRRPRTTLLAHRRAGHRQEPPRGRVGARGARARGSRSRGPMLGGRWRARILALGGIASRLRSRG